MVSTNELFKKDGNPLVPPYRYHMMLEETTRAVLKDSGLDAAYPDLQAFCLAQQEVHSAANKRMIEAIRSNPAVQGYCVHALTGGDWVLGAGLGGRHDGGHSPAESALPLPGDLCEKRWDRRLSGNPHSRDGLPLECDPAGERRPAVPLGKQHALGLWVGVSHVVLDHPVFAGLPVNCMMGQEYENVWSPHSLKGVEGDLIVGSVSYGFHAEDNENQDYRGPEPAWYAMDMGTVAHGRGRYVLSTLRLLDNLGVDPVADKILFNLIDWVR